MKYPSPISRWHDNVVYLRDGSVWVNFLTRGVRYDRYRAQEITNLQDAHGQLYTALHELTETPDVIIGSTLEPVTARERLQRAVGGIDGYSPDDPRFAELNTSLAHYNTHALQGGIIPTNRRVYFISVRMPIRIPLMERLRSSYLGADIFNKSRRQQAMAFAETVARAIPASYRAIPATTRDMQWIYTRACTRGVDLTPMPADTQKLLTSAQLGETGGVVTSRPAPPVTDPVDGFTDIEIDPLADSAVTVDQFAEQYARGVPGAASVRRFADYFSTLRRSKIISIVDPARRTDTMPEGPKSFQTVLAVTGYPSEGDYAVDSIMGLIDRDIGVDGDWVQRIHFPDRYDDNMAVNEDMRKLEMENQSNSKSVLDTQRYGTQASELAAFAAARDNEPGATPVHVTTLMSFGSPSATHLTRAMSKVTSLIQKQGYRVLSPVGGQVELWKSMLPCTPRTDLVEELQGASTAMLVGAFGPMQRIGAGDLVGVPFATVIDNNLGTEIFLDVMNATLSGNGSIAFTGAQGKGKSHAMGVVAHGLHVRGAHTVYLDTQGEWASFVNALSDFQVVELKEPTVSIDPLRVFGHTPEGLDEALRILRGILLPMLGVRSDSEEGAALASFMDPDWVTTRHITTTRQLLETIRRFEGKHTIKKVLPVIDAMLSSTYMGAFIDPAVGPPLPVAKLDARAIVFLTAGLTVPTKDDTDQWTVEERYTIMANTAVAMITKLLFDRVRGVPAVFFMDEAKTYEDLDVLTPLIAEPDRKGRKHGQWVVVGSQTGSDFHGPAYKLIRRRVCMGQDTLANAREALAWAGFPVTDELVSRLVSRTSPLDPETGRPLPGRAGECYFHDGMTFVRAQVHQHWDPNVRRLANTKSDSYTRYADLKKSGKV